MDIKQGILNLKTIHLSSLGKLICPKAEYIRCAVPRRGKQSLKQALYASQKLMSVDEMLSSTYMVSLQQLKLNEFEVLTGLLFLDEFVCKIELEHLKLIYSPGFSFTQHRHNSNEAQLIITKNNFRYFLGICSKISYREVEDVVKIN